jgi:hypothetical protein
VQRYSAIRYAVRAGVVKYLFQIYSLLGSFTLIPACFALASGRWLTAGVYLAVAGLMLLMGFFSRRMPGPARQQRNDVTNAPGQQPLQNALPVCDVLFTSLPVAGFDAQSS